MAKSMAYIPRMLIRKIRRIAVAGREYVLGRSGEPQVLRYSRFVCSRSVISRVVGGLQSSAALPAQIRSMCLKELNLDRSSSLVFDFEEHKRVRYHEIRTICLLPRYQNIRPPPDMLRKAFVKYSC